MSIYQVAMEQYIEETGFSSRNFESNFKECGWDFVAYYYERAMEQRMEDNSMYQG